MKKLRLKMIGIVFASVVAAFMVMTIILVMCFGAYRNRQADQITAMISENNGTVPQLKDYKQQQKNKQHRADNRPSCLHPVQFYKFRACRRSFCRRLL